MRPNRLFIVVPCYNEEEVLPETSKRLHEKLTDLISAGKIAADSRIAFVNDGSKDKTWDIICDLHKQSPLFTGINLSRNRGHQNALLGGLMTVKNEADMAISMDADLQDDINAIDEMVEKYLNGCDIVYGVRSKRDTDTFFKRFTAESFYRVMDKMGAKTVFNHADYRLMSKRALEGLSQFKEVNLFLRGIVPMIGYPADSVYYERAERFAGESKYPLKKMISFSVEGITSLSTAPISFITKLGIVMCALSLVMLIALIVLIILAASLSWCAEDMLVVLSGLGATLVSVWVIGGVLLMSVGVVGGYVGKIYLEAKGRPRYIIRDYLEDEGN